MRIDRDLIFQESGILGENLELQQLIQECAQASRKAGESTLENWFRPNPKATWEVSGKALRRVLHEGKDVSDIRTEEGLSNCLVFHTRNLPGSVVDDQVLSLHRRVDGAVESWLGSLFEDDEFSIAVTGHFMYPPGGYMGWHTNHRNPGWRVYVNFAEQPGKSFFRYRDPETDRIVTSVDGIWNLRLFQISPELPLWHAVYSDTYRHSFGYLIILKGS